MNRSAAPGPVGEPVAGVNQDSRLQASGAASGTGSPTGNAATQRERVYIVKRTLIERCFYDPVELAQKFGVTTADEVIELFEKHDGSMFGDEIFPGDASPEVYTELEERWDDD